MSVIKPFEKDTCREFVFIGFRECHGERYIMLRDKESGLDSLPGYEQEGWKFRVKCESFQLDWSETEAWDEYVCFIPGFKCDRDDGSPTDFPELIQDIHFVLEKLYPESEFDKPRYFEVLKRPGEEY